MTHNSFRNVVLLPAMVLGLIFAGAQAIADERIDSLPAFVERGMGLWHVPGMAVTVVNSEEVLFRQGFGETAIENGAPIGEHTLFASASTNKAMIAAGILMLADEGKLSLDDLATRYLPELHFNNALLTEQITIRDLLAHRTGLPSTDFWAFFLNMPLEEQVQRLSAVPPANPFRTGFIYQNTMFELAGLIIERISGKRWDRFLTERLWQPVGMHETYGARGQIPAGRDHVLPYDLRDGALMQSDWDIPKDLADAAGSAWTSIHDMGLWAQFLLRGGVTKDGQRLLSEGGVEEMFKPQQLIPAKEFYPASFLSNPSWHSYGLGWFQQDFQGRKIDFHTGSLTGLIAIIGLDRANDRAVVVLGNRDHAEMRHAVLWEVMDQSPNGEHRDWNQDVFDLYQGNSESGREKQAEFEKKRLKRTRPSLAKKAYLGRYTNAAMGEVTIEADGRRLKLNTGFRELAMSHWHLDTFLVEYEPWGMKEFATFRIGPEGSINALEFFELVFEPQPSSE